MVRHLLRGLLRWIFWHPIRYTVQSLPLRMVYFFGQIGGMLYYYVHKERRRRIDNALSLTSLGMSEEQRKEAIKKSCVNLIYYELGVLLYPRMNEKNIDRYSELIGREHIDKAMSEGKGVLLVHAHFGNAQMLMPALGYRGYEINQVGLLPTDVADDLSEVFEREKDASAVKELERRTEYEKSLPAKFIYLKASMRPIFEALKRSGIVAVAIDGVGGAKKINLSFLGRRADFSAGPIGIAYKTGATLLPLFTVRDGHKYRVIIEPPLELAGTESPEGVAINSLRFVNILEGYIKKYPCHYIRLFGYNKPFFTDSAG